MTARSHVAKFVQNFTKLLLISLNSHTNANIAKTLQLYFTFCNFVCSNLHMQEIAIWTFLTLFSMGNWQFFTFCKAKFVQNLTTLNLISINFHTSVNFAKTLQLYFTFCETLKILYTNSREIGFYTLFSTKHRFVQSQHIVLNYKATIRTRQDIQYSICGNTTSTFE